ncbi:MAG: hypothetical protein RR058_00615 [Oscillospiraceae bacterium]
MKRQDRRILPLVTAAFAFGVILSFVLPTVLLVTVTAVLLAASLCT